MACIGDKTHCNLVNISMQKQTLISLLAGFVIGGVVAAYFSGESEPLEVSEMSVSSEADDRMMSHTSDSRMAHMQQMFVTSERAFIEKMIPHHQEAIDTATEVLERGGTTEAVHDLMERIIEAQTAEIELMRDWHEAWYDEPHVDQGTYEPMMRDLAALSGDTLDRAFLEDMIPHHMGAIMMARSVQPYIEHDELATLTANIVEAQSAEMVEMRELLIGL